MFVVNFRKDKFADMQDCIVTDKETAFIFRSFQLYKCKNSNTRSQTRFKTLQEGA